MHGQAQAHDILAIIVENLPTPVYAKDSDLRFVVANRAQREMCGQTEAQLIGKSDLEVHASDLAKGFMERERKLLETRKEYTIEEDVDNATTGQRVRVLTRKTVVTGADGNTYILGTNSDLTQLKKREAQQKLLTEAVPVGVLQVDEEGTVAYSNSLLVEYLGLKASPSNLRDVQTLLDTPPPGFPGTPCKFESGVHIENQKGRRLLVMSSGWKRLEHETAKSAIISLVDISEVTALREKFAGQSQRLDGVLHQAKDSLSQISSSTRSLNGGADTLSRQTDEQMANLEEMSSAIRELAAAIRQSADNSHAARDLATTANTLALEGSQISSSVRDAISQIAETNQRVLSITDLIQEIAFQTNLLSLNAAVEAARAGDLGRGFAVVASEVRALAQRSASALKDIHIHIRESRKQLEEGTSLATILNESMAKIAASTRQSADLVLNISNACNEQAEGVQQIDKSVTYLENVAQNNARLAEHVTQSVKSVDQAIKSLAETVQGRPQDGREQMLGEPVQMPRRGAA